MQPGDRLDTYNVVLDRFQPGTVCHVHADEVALVLLDEKRKDGGNWYSMFLLKPPEGVRQGIDFSVEAVRERAIKEVSSGERQ